MSLTPWQLRGGRWIKREDLYRLPNGVNGAKLRACRYLLEGAKANGATRVISAASPLSPQNAMAATLAQELGMGCTIIVGGTWYETALRHRSFVLATQAGAEVLYMSVGYNPALQKAASRLAERIPSSYWLRYGISLPPDADEKTIRGFHATSAYQTDRFPAQVRTLILPFGSGNTGAGVLHGLAKNPPKGLVEVVLMVIGPSRLDWLRERMTLLGTPLRALPFELTMRDLHGTGFAAYGDAMPETLDGIVLHPTYEGKVVRFLDRHSEPYWTRRDGSTALWIVGGPLPKES